MKYIRTKSNYIYRTLEDFMQSDLPQSKIRVENVHKGWYVVIYKSEIIKEVDAIEELCDEFVFFDENNKPRLCYKKWLKDTFNSFKTIYGAIWTERGLIYVAKMKGVLPNDDIDWELL